MDESQRLQTKVNGLQKLLNGDIGRNIRLDEHRDVTILDIAVRSFLKGLHTVQVHILFAGSALAMVEYEKELEDVLDCPVLAYNSQKEYGQHHWKHLLNSYRDWKDNALQNVCRFAQGYEPKPLPKQDET